MDSELEDLYRMARVLVAPSKHEGYGLTLSEAITHGSQIVASDIAAHRYVVGPGNAEFFTSDSVDDLARAVESAWNRPPAGYDATWSWEDAARMQVELYETLVRNGT